VATKHKLFGERVNNPSKKQIRRIVGSSHTAARWPGIRPGYVYTVVRAISARVNQNYDGWPSAELKEAAHTFVGKPVFVNHENYDPKKARGVVVAARYIENGADKYIETVMEIDAKRFPKLAHEIRTGGLDSVSMGAEAGFTICSACGNKAVDEDDFCDHVRFHKGERIHVRNRRTGKVEEKLVFESCHKLSFFELSYVFDPADETAVASKVLVANRRTAAAGQCGPGDDSCARSTPGGIGPVPPGLSGDMGGSSAAAGSSTDLGKTPATGGDSGGTPQAGDAKYMPQTKPLYDDLVKSFPGADIGTYRVDDFHEHDHGAMDFMTSDPAQADAVKQKAFDAGAPYVLWQQKQWNADGTSSGMPDRGSPTDNHMDHVHIGPIPGKAAVRQRVLAKLAGASDDYWEWAKRIDSGEEEPETGPKQALPNKGLTDWAERARKRTVAFAEGEWDDADETIKDTLEGKPFRVKPKKQADLPPAANSQLTQRPGTMGTYNKAHAYFDKMGAPTDGVLDYGAGLGHSAQFGHTYEPHPRDGFEPTYVRAEDVPEGAHGRITNLNVLNVVPPEIRHQIVDGIGRSLAPGGHAIITTRGANEVAATKSAIPADNGDPGAFIVNPGTNRETYQKGFTPKELHSYVSQRLGPNYTVSPVKIGPAGVHVIRNAAKTASLKGLVRTAMYKKLGWGETEAPAPVDTLREEGSAPEDDNDDWHHYVDSPPELSMPDLSEAAQIDRDQAEGAQVPGMAPGDMGQPGPSSVAPQAPGADPAADEGNFMTLKIPLPQQTQPVAPPMAPGSPVPASPQVPQHTFASRISVRTLAAMERHYGRRLANWHDAIEAGRAFTPEEDADFRRQAALLTLENGAADSPTGRNTVKGTANMARSSLATRRKTAGTKHFAEGPLVDTGDQSRNDEGEQEEAFITSVPPEVNDDLPDDDTPNISNTEDNLVADEAYAHSLTSKLQRQKAALERTALEYAEFQRTGRRFRAELDGDSDVGYSGGPVAEEVNPEVPVPSAEKLTGDDFDSADPGAGIDTSVAGPGTTTLPIESNVKAFQTFDRWLHKHTGKHVRDHSEVAIKRAAAQFAAHNKIKVAAMFPALGIALREARKVEAARKKESTQMRKRAVDLETAAPDERVSVPAPVADTTDAEAQASQFDESGWDNNAGKDITDPDLGTGQNWAPGQAPKESRKTVAKADGILAVRCAEAMIAAGLEPNTRERKYQLAAEYEKMSRGLILDRTAMAEKFAMVRQADRQAYQQRVASGRTRGTAPLPPGFTQGGAPAKRTASRRQAANDPSNDALLFG